MNRGKEITGQDRDAMLAAIFQIPINGLPLISKRRYQYALIDLYLQDSNATQHAVDWMQKLYNENPDHPAFKDMSAEVKVQLEALRTTTLQSSKKDYPNGRL
jgi:hypothetical protein